MQEVKIHNKVAVMYLFAQTLCTEEKIDLTILKDNTKI